MSLQHLTETEQVHEHLNVETENMHTASIFTGKNDRSAIERSLPSKQRVELVDETDDQIELGDQSMEQAPPGTDAYLKMLYSNKFVGLTPSHAHGTTFFNPKGQTKERRPLFGVFDQKRIQEMNAHMQRDHSNLHDPLQVKSISSPR